MNRRKITLPLSVVGGQQLLFTFCVEVAPWNLINAACFIFPKKWDKTFWKMQDNVLTANLLSQASGVFVTFILKEYDFVFDVEIQEGSPRLKLPYNLTGMRYYYIVFFYIIILLRCTKFSFRGRSFEEERRFSEWPCKKGVEYQESTMGKKNLLERSSESTNMNVIWKLILLKLGTLEL